MAESHEQDTARAQNWLTPGGRFSQAKELVPRATGASARSQVTFVPQAHLSPISFGLSASQKVALAS